VALRGERVADPLLELGYAPVTTIDEGMAELAGGERA
jgi:hypothetical protein